jgi:hypothetical protein
MDKVFSFSKWIELRIKTVILVVSSEKADVRSEKEKTDNGFFILKMD